MGDFFREDLRGSRFERVDLSGSEFSASDLNDTRFRGVELVDVDIHGEIVNVTINGVDVAPLVEAELDRRMPERALMRPSDADGFRTAFATLDVLWAGTLDRARALPPEALHEQVDEEWSFIETLRHLGFAHACWVGGVMLADPSPWHPLDLPWDEAPTVDGVPWDRDVRPSLDEVLAVRAQRRTTVAGVLDGLTDEELSAPVTSATPFLQDAEGLTVAQCLGVVVNEEWEHRLYAERDLSALSA